VNVIQDWISAYSRYGGRGGLGIHPAHVEMRCSTQPPKLRGSHFEQQYALAAQFALSKFILPHEASERGSNL
jgi:hypothetical protein